MYNIIMFKAKWDRQIIVYMYFSKYIVRDIISTTVLKIKVWENYKMNGMLLFSRIKVFENISILLVNAEWMNIVAFKMHFRASQSQIMKNKPLQNYSLHKIFTAHFPSKHHFCP